MDIRSNLHKRMSSLRQNKDISIESKKIPSHALKAVAFSIQFGCRAARNHPFVTGLALFLLLLYSYLPSLFGFLVSSSPVIICTTLLLGTLLSFGEPDLPEIDEEEMKMSHDVSSSTSMQQVCAVPDELVTKKDDEETETSAAVAFHKREIEDVEDPTVSLHVDEGMVHENESGSLHTQGVSVSSRAILKEDSNVVIGVKREFEDGTRGSRIPFHGFPDVDDEHNDGSTISTTERDLESKKYVETGDSAVINQVIDSATEIPGLHSAVLTEEVEQATTGARFTNKNWDKDGLQPESSEETSDKKDKKEEFFEKIYIHEEMLAEDASVGADSVPDLDPTAHEGTVYVKAEGDGTPTGICYYSLLSTKKSIDGPDDSGSDAAESSSSDASMADIIPMLDELRPFLDADLSRPVHINIDSNDDGDDGDEDDDEDDASEESSHDAKSDSAAEEHVAEDQPHPATQAQNTPLSEFVLSWTPDDEKNLMDLGLSEFERNQRLENMIARRRARKDLESMMSFPANSSALTMNRIAPLDVHIPPVSIRRNNPFDDHYDFQELNGLPPVPGSAPSVFSRKRNPFEFPYWERNDNQNATRDGLHPLEFLTEKVGLPSSQGVEDSKFGPSSSGDNIEEKPASNFAPHFPAAKTESATYSKYERQLSRLSDPRLSSISEPESISPMVQRCDALPGGEGLLQENHCFGDVAVQPEKQARDTDFSSIKGSLDISTRSDLDQHEITNELEPAVPDAPHSIVVECGSDEPDASTETDDAINANNHEVTIASQSTKPCLFTDSNASVNATTQGSDVQIDDLGLSAQDLNSADETFITVPRSFEWYTIPPNDILNVSNDDAVWLREIAEMRKLELSGSSQETQAQSNMHFASVSSTESCSYEQLQASDVQRMDTPISYFKELAAADSLNSCTPGHPYLPVDEPVHLPSCSCSESRIDILPPISEEIATDSDHEEQHGTLGTVMEKSHQLLSADATDLSLPEYPTPQIELPTVSLFHDSTTASPNKETVKNVDDGSVDLSMDEFGTSQFLDIHPYDEDHYVTTRSNEARDLDEGLLSELDVVGDFSVQNLNSSRTQGEIKSISHSHLEDNGLSPVISEEAQPLCEDQEHNTDVSQTNSHMSPLLENDISVGLPAKEYKGDDMGLLDSRFEHHNGKTNNMEDISSVLHESDASFGRNVILDSATDYRLLSQMEFNATGDSANELDAAEDGGYHGKMAYHSHMQEVEAESIDDIHHALKNYVSDNMFLTEQPANMQFITSFQEAEAHNLECTDLAVEQLSIVSSSHIPIQNIEDIGISCDDVARSSGAVHSAVEHQIEFASDSTSGKSEAEAIPSLVISHSSLNEVETSVDDEVDEKPLKDAVAALPAAAADPNDSESHHLEDVQLTVRQTDICLESAAASSSLFEVEENSAEELILKQKDAYFESWATHADLPEAERLSLNEKKMTFFQQEKQNEETEGHSQIHVVDVQSVDDLQAVFRQQGIDSAYGIQIEPHEVEQHSEENLLGTKLNFSHGQEDGSGMQTIDHAEMHEIEAQSLEDIHMAFGRHVTETKSETDLRATDTNAVDELLVEEVKNLGFARDPLRRDSEILGDTSEIHEIEARSLDDLHVLCGKHSAEDFLAINSEPHVIEPPSVTILKKETTDVDCAVDQQKDTELTPRLSEMHEVEARSYDDLHIFLQQQGALAETVIYSELQKEEEKSVPIPLEKEPTDEDSTGGKERHIKPTDHSKMHEVEAGSPDSLEIGLRYHSDKNIHDVQTQSAEDSIETKIIDSDLLVNQDLLDAEETPVYGLHMSDEELFTQSGFPDQGNLSSSELHEIEARSLDELHLALSQETTKLDTLEKEVNISESQSIFHEIAAYSLDDLHMALGKHVLPLKTSIIKPDHIEVETRSIGEGNMHSESSDSQHNLHEIEVHSLNDLHLALGKQGMLSALTQEEHKVEIQSPEQENAHSGPSGACFDLPGIEVSSGDVASDSSIVQSDVKKFEIPSPEKERNLLESAAEHPLQEIEAESIEDINFAFEQFVENQSPRDGHVETEQTQNVNNEVKSLSSEVSLSEPESRKLVSQVFVDKEALISNLDAPSTKTLE